MDIPKLIHSNTSTNEIDVDRVLDDCQYNRMAKSTPTNMRKSLSIIFPNVESKRIEKKNILYKQHDHQIKENIHVTAET